MEQKKVLVRKGSSHSCWTEYGEDAGVRRWLLRKVGEWGQLVAGVGWHVGRGCRVEVGGEGLLKGEGQRVSDWPPYCVTMSTLLTNMV